MSVTATIKLAEDEAQELSAAVETAEVAAHAIDLHAVSDAEWEVILYFHEANEHRRTAVAGMATRITGRPAAVEWRELPETDWVRRSQEALPAVRVGRVLVYPAHHRDQVRENDVAILIEAGQAFGTGHHASTRGCLLAIQGALKSRQVRSALDIGTGTGVLAIALARQGVAVVATDIDPIAVRLAQENVRMNRVAARVDVRPTPSLSRTLPRSPARGGGYDLVVANILMEPLLALAPAIRRAVAPGGLVILSGLLPQQRIPISATYRSVGLRLKRWFVLDGWLTVVLERAAGTPKRDARPRRPGSASATNPRRSR